MFAEVRELKNFLSTLMVPSRLGPLQDLEMSAFVHDIVGFTKMWCLIMSIEGNRHKRCLMVSSSSPQT